MVRQISKTHTDRVGYHPNFTPLFLLLLLLIYALFDLYLFVLDVPPYHSLHCLVIPNSGRNLAPLIAFIDAFHRLDSFSFFAFDEQLLTFSKAIIFLNDIYKLMFFQKRYIIRSSIISIIILEKKCLMTIHQWQKYVKIANQMLLQDRKMKKVIFIDKNI